MTQTYGQQAVGLNDNPSDDPTVRRIKKRYTEMIDDLFVQRGLSRLTGQKRLFSLAITEMQIACMWAVKALTWKEED